MSFHIFICIYKPDSVSRLRKETDDSYLSCLAVASKIFAVQTHVKRGSTTLHARMDLAVSSLSFDRTHPKGMPQVFTLGVSARTTTFAGDGSYPLRLIENNCVSGLSSLASPFGRGFEQPSDTNRVILSKNLTLSKGYDRLCL